jgi:hypothetical protein
LVKRKISKKGTAILHEKFDGSLRLSEEKRFDVIDENY